MNRIGSPVATAVDTGTCCAGAAAIVDDPTRRLALFGVWWIDGVASLFIVWIVMKEGREAWRNECGCR